MRRCISAIGRIALAAALVPAVGAGGAQAQGRSRFECLDPDNRTVTRIVGGSLAPRDMAPWQVSLQVDVGERWRRACGGGLRRHLPGFNEAAGIPRGRPAGWPLPRRRVGLQ